MHTQYLEYTLDYNLYPKIVKSIAAAIKKHAPSAQAIAFRGLSGTLVGMGICAALKLPPIVVRKGRDHSSYRVEGHLDANRVVIVDDFSSTGRTIREILSAVLSGKKKWLWESSDLRCDGIFLYRDSKDRTHLEWKNSKIPVYYRDIRSV